ncbi:hypothetical protein ZIOFF_006095 [Zingiber officinale]|uniref:Uncharacterized protein n=1 Tax=Zingiber officinale TaxID=94328 RepID=A0A8J5LN32_ZINOF|nr:hypothetical protein ZIOFF_006095 [Zingiber officinale]
MYIWSHFLFPVVCGKSNVNPQSRDLVLQLVERILSGPKAQTILLNDVVRKGERIVPPAVLDLLMRATFPASTARVKNEDALSRNTDPSQVASIKEADKYCKTILMKLTRNFGCMKGSVLVLVLGIASCSYCYLLSIPPMLRKYDFHLALSGNRYYISDQFTNLKYSRVEIDEVRFEWAECMLDYI